MGSKWTDETLAVARLPRLFELRAASSLARFLADRGDLSDARQLLATSIDRMPAQTATRDLVEAHEVLESVQRRPGATQRL